MTQHPLAPGARPPWQRPGPLVAVAVGGALGTAARAGVDVWLGTPAGWPLSTFAVNVLGALALGVLLAGRPGAGGPGGVLRLVAGTGFLGAFTTYSALAAQTAALVTGRAVGTALAYTGGTLAIGLLAAAAGAGLGAVLRDRS